MSEQEPQPAPVGTALPRWVITTLLAGGAVVVVLLVVIVVLLIHGNGSDNTAKDKSSGSAGSLLSPGPKTFEAAGNVTLTDSGNEGLGGGACQGAGGYSDMVEGGQVVVTDASGKTVAVGSLGAGHHGGGYGACVFPFTVEDVPSGVGPYSVEVTHRGKIAFTEDEASDIELTLGD